MEKQKRTPMMEQYLAIKEQCKDELLFFRLGDFYEMFFDDALTASRELELTLTGRAGGSTEKVPMCGVPYHSADTYIARLVQKGYKVAICEQMEDPKSVKGIVKREITKVITPGTILIENAITAKNNNYLGIIRKEKDDRILAFVDVSTGECLWGRIEEGREEEQLIDMLAIYQPAEIIYENIGKLEQTLREYMEQKYPHCPLSPYEAPMEGEDLSAVHFSSSEDLEQDEVRHTIHALLHYARHVMKTDISHINLLSRIDNASRLVLDGATLRHLEITQNVRDGGRKGTLLDVLDYTQTAMGGRLLRRWLESPLLHPKDIQGRQDAVGELLSNEILRQEIKAVLEQIYDFERILTRMETGNATPKDMVALRETLQVVPKLKELLQEANSPLLKRLYQDIEEHEDVWELLHKGIKESPALALKNGGVIAAGYHAELDELRSLSENSKQWIQNLETEEKEKTGIRLKIGYNKVFGYYFEISHANTIPVPAYYVRKQTLANAERYITPELKEFEIKVLSAQEKILALEAMLYSEIREQIKEHISSMQQSARAIACLDCLASFAEAAWKHRYIAPQIRKENRIWIHDGRHPIIEQFIGSGLFVPNDIRLDHETHEVLLITGPNMAGKSTYMRQAAVLTLLAQTGSFIPAREAIISPVDRIFTRIGASDDILSGESTFMVEMKEVSHILKYATKNSLIILDEIGRGTSTFDGMSIARAVVEYIRKKIQAYTLFATHYHELVDITEQSDKIRNYTVAVKERGSEIRFLRRIIPGAADRSYGIHVAKLAGLPKTVIQRADEILKELESTGPVEKPSLQGEGKQKENSLFVDPVLEKIKSLDVLSLTPIEALDILYKLQQEVKEGDGR